MTTRAVTPRVLTPPPRLGKGVSAFPLASAMVWSGVGHPHEAVAVPGVRLAPGDVLVEVELATVCGSDVHTVRGHRVAPTPLVLGHEQVGRVVALGRGGARTVEGVRLETGMRVVWSVVVPCGRCASCRRGQGQACAAQQYYGHERMRRGWELSGGFATHVHVLAGTPVVIAPEHVSSAVLAPASCATATVVAVLDAASAVVPLEDSVVVIAGAGMLGLTASAMAKDAGAHVVVSDPDEVRRRGALAFGADAVADPRAPAAHPSSIASAIVAAAGRGARCAIALELSGAASAVRTLVDLVDVGGVVVFAGTVSPGAGLRVDPEQIVRRLLTIRGVHNYAPAQLERAVGYLAEACARYPFAEQVAHILPLAAVDEALEAAAAALAPRVGLSPALQGRCGSLSEVVLLLPEEAVCWR